MLFFQSSSLAPGLCLPCLGVRFSPALSVLLCFLFSFVWGLLGFAPQSLAFLFSVSSLLPFAPAVGLLLACVVCFAVLFVVLFWRPLRLGSAGVCPSVPGCSFLRPCCCLLLLPLVFFRASLLCVSSCSCFVCLCLLLFACALCCLVLTRRGTTRFPSFGPCAAWPVVFSSVYGYKLGSRHVAFVFEVVARTFLIWHPGCPISEVPSLGPGLHQS